jgi:hypothetical protein
MSTADRFWSKVNGSDVADCWVWTAALNHGYGVFYTHVDSAGRRRLIGAHRWAYDFLRGPFPDGLQLDHLCRNRACVNPWHLEPVTSQVNSERGSWGMRQTCPQGHAYNDENTGRRTTRRGRECLTCRRAFHEQRRQANRAALLADPALAPHGTLTTYNDWMCRCQPCRDASAEYRRAHRARRVA